MPSRTYQVNYDITGVSTEAVKAFEALKAPMSEISTAIKTASENMAILMEQAKAFKAMGKDLVITPKINTKSFADALATMEANVKASSMRMRASLEAALSGSRADHKRVNDLLGTDNWKRAMSEQRHELESLSKKLELLRAARDKYSTGKSAASELARNRANQTFSGYTDPNKRVADIIKKAGLGNIFTKSGDQWGFAGGDSRAKFKDYIKNLESQEAELKNAISSAKKANEQFFGNVKNETAFNRKGNFVERMLGISPEQLKEIQPTLNTINSLMGGVAQAQEKVQNVTKRTPIPKPVKPTSLPSKKTMRDLKNSISEARQQQAGVWARDNEIQSWQRLEDAGKLNEFGRKNLEKLKKQRAIWAASQNEGTAPNQKIQELTNQYSAYQKQRAEYAKQLVDWRKRPYTETTEQITTGVTQAQKAASQPIKLNVTGNFAKQIQPLLKLSSALTAIPKAPVDVAVNVSISSGAVTGLEAIKKNLQAINAARGKIAKGGVSNIEKLAATARGEVKKNPITSRVGVDGSAANSELTALIQTLKEQAAKNLISLKAVIDIKGVKGELSTIISELKKKAREAGISIKAKLDVSGISKPFTEKIAALKRQATKSNLSIKAKLDSAKMSTDLRKKIKALKDIATKNPIKLRATIDTSMIAKDLNKAIANTGKNPLKNMPSIKVTLDTSEATAALNKLLTSIKAASPQNIKLGATTGGAAKGKAAGTIGSAVTAPVNNTTPRISTRGISTAAATAAAIRNATPSKRPGVIDRLRKSLYPLTGNVSLGASTPVALDMAKGMGVMYGVGGAMNLVTGGLTDAMEYQNTMETAEEILKRNYSGKNFGKDFKDMATEVRRVAKQTKFTAPQAADATRFMAMAGLSVPMIKASVSPIADVAVIGDNDFGEVADKMTNIQTAFQIQPNKMRHTADALTNTFTHTNTDMMMLAESMQYAAPMAHLTGMSLDDTLAMVGIMGNSGIQASMAGTTLRMMMQNTLNPNKGQVALWKKLGVNTRDSSGNLRNMIDILADVKVAQKGSGLTMADVVSNLFRVTASAGAGSLIENIDDVKKLALQNRGIGNVSEEISERKQNTVKGMWAQMTSAFTEANLQVFEQFQGDIIGMIKAVRDYFSSKEAVENLRAAFELIKDLMGLFGEIAKIWMSVYNKFNGFIKFIIKAQFVVAQFGYMLKPIMSLVNVFGGLKSLAVGFVSALSGGAAIKKATTGLALASAVTGGAMATETSLSRGRNTIAYQRDILANNALMAKAAMSSASSYSVYKNDMNRMMMRQAGFDFTSYYFANRKQKEIANSARAARIFDTILPQAGKKTSLPTGIRSSALGKAVLFGDVAYTASALKGANGRPLYFNKAYKGLAFARLAADAQYLYSIRHDLPNRFRGSQLYAMRKSDQLENEMAQLKQKRLDNLKAARRPFQLKNFGLLQAYYHRYGYKDNDINKLYLNHVEELKKASKLRTAGQIGDLALMYRYNRFLHWKNENGRIKASAVNKDAVKFLEERNKRMTVLRETRRAEQLQNASGSMFYRAGRIGGKGRWVSFGNVVRGGFTAGYTALSFKSMTSGLFTSIKSGFLSLISGISRLFGALVSPLGAVTVAISGLVIAATLADKRMREQAEASRQLTNKMVNNTYQTSNMGVIDYGGKAPKSKYIDIQPTENLPNVKKRNKKYYVAWDSRFYSPNKKGILPDVVKEVDAWQSAFIEPNKQIFGNDYKLFSRDAMLKNTRETLSKSGKYKAYGADKYLLNDAHKADLKNLQGLSQLSTLYIEGANSKKASSIRDRIISLREQLSAGNITKDKYQASANDLLAKNGLTEEVINKIPRFTDDPNKLKNQADWTKFQQYHLGMYNQLLSEIRGDQNTLGGYFEGVDKIKSGVAKYSNAWWDAIRHIIGGMRTTIDTAGNAVQIKFDTKTGLVEWQNVIAQIKKFNKNFKDTMYNYLKLMGQAYGAMVDNGIVGNYFKDWRNFYIEQNKHRNVSENDARYYYSQRGYSGERLENEVKDGLWTRSGRERAKIRRGLAIQRADEAKRAHDKQVKAIKDRQKALVEAAEESQKSLDNSGAGGSSTSPLAAAKDTNKSLGNHHNQGSVSARPTQINIRVDKLANFDKIQFLKGEEKDMAEALQRAVAEAVSNIVPMMDSLVSNDKMVTA